MSLKRVVWACTLLFILSWFWMVPRAESAAVRARDPGVRGGGPAAGEALARLSPGERQLFVAGRAEFQKVEGVGTGLGPRFNLDNCVGCHAHPAVGGTSPKVNPQVAAATALGARNVVPSFITLNGPARAVRFRLHPDGSRDGHVHPLFVVSGRKDRTGDATGCAVKQEDFDAQAARGNVSYRIATPLFGAGLLEHIPDRTILANREAASTAKRALGIVGHPNRSEQDGTVTRFGWKAQDKSLLHLAGETYNVEMGITSELFPTEKEDDPSCQFFRIPNDMTRPHEDSLLMALSTTETLALFMRFLAPPTPSVVRPAKPTSIAKGQALFESVGCAQCHTPMLRTGNAAVAALRNQDVNLFSDLLLHGMGPGLADDIIQGRAGPDEFRTAPLWGLGKRIFFLHDGRTTDLLEAIGAHRSTGNAKFRASEANAVVRQFTTLDEVDKQHLLNFLRSL